MGNVGKSPKAVLGHDVHSALLLGRMLLDEGAEVGLEVLRRREGDQEDAKQLPAFEDALSLTTS